MNPELLPKPEQIFAHALRFHWTTDLLHDPKHIELDKRPVVAIPASVLAAFTIELYLKCLAMIEGGIFPDIHNLEELFRRLTPAMQAAIVYNWDAAMSTPDEIIAFAAAEHQMGLTFPRDLASALNACSRAFVQLRYIYEPNNTGAQYYLGDFPRLLLARS